MRQERDKARRQRQAFEHQRACLDWQVAAKKERAARAKEAELAMLRHLERRDQETEQLTKAVKARKAEADARFRAQLLAQQRYARARLPQL